jgi:hypothetical protein
MQYALIKSDSTGLGRVHNVIVADAEFIEHIATEWDHIEALDTLHEQGLGVGIGWGYDLAAGAFIAPTPAAEPADQRPTIVVTSITADPSHAAQLVLKGLREVTCLVGTELQAEAELRQAGALVPMDDAFRMPLRSRDGRERVLLGTMTQGQIRFRVTLPESGVWSVTEDAINEAIPPEQRMAFAGLSIYVVEA